MHKLFVHYRIDEPFGKRKDRAVTSCLLLDEEYHILGKGVAIRSYLDQYNDHRGKQIAEGRARYGYALLMGKGERRKWKVRRYEALDTLLCCNLAGWKDPEEDPSELTPDNVYVHPAFRSKVFSCDNMELHEKEKYALERFIEKENKKGSQGSESVG